MERPENDSIQAFDTLYTTNQIQILKILLPYCEPQARRSLAVMIKFLEFQYTLSFTRTHPECFSDPAPPLLLGGLVEKIGGYCPPQLRSMLEQLRSMQNALEMYEEMKQVMDLFQATEEASETEKAASSGEAAFRAGADSHAGTDSHAGADPRAGADSHAGADSGAGSGFRQDFDPMSMLMGMLSPGQQEMFKMFQSDFETRAAEAPKEPPEKEN